MLEKLLSDLKGIYNIPFHDIVLHRDMIGYVCVVSCNNDKYILKLFKNRNAKPAIQSIEIMTYLEKVYFPTAHIIATAAGEACFTLDFQGEDRIGVLYEYIQGSEPNKNTDIITIGRQTGKLHKLMEEYPLALSCHEKSFYIDRYIQCLKEMNYPKVSEFQAYGDLLWSRLEKLPRGFCHGDYHTGNMLLNERNEYAIFDFDAAARAFSMYDIAVFCDMTNYFNLSECEYAETHYMLEEFIKGYKEYNSISDQELQAIDCFIAIRHYEVQATIIENLGIACIDQEFVDDQLSWLMKWEKLHGT
ncbi:MAG: aminoglycoside phosphotransferase [Herbinix sp.]|nr:aminoglycoside phosphotransferase [Herbinix sp.]